MPEHWTHQGKADMNLTSGLPPYHPLVEGQGFDPAAVDAGLREDAANVVKAGYNSRGVSLRSLPCPEEFFEPKRIKTQSSSWVPSSPLMFLQVAWTTITGTAPVLGMVLEARI